MCISCFTGTIKEQYPEFYCQWVSHKLQNLDVALRQLAPEVVTSVQSPHVKEIK